MNQKGRPEGQQVPPDDAFGGRYNDISLATYELIHESLIELEHELAAWNQKAAGAGADAPYREECSRLQQMIRFGDERLQSARQAGGFTVDIGRVSIGSVRIWVASLLFRAHHEKEELEKRREGNWPPKVLEAISARVARIENLAEGFHLPPAEMLKGLLPNSGPTHRHRWDVFISHASEDKDSVARPLAKLLRERRLEVWYDDFTLSIGDSLRRSIDQGLRLSRFAVVILSPHFFSKEWPKKELDGLYALETRGRNLILPIWHDVSADDVARFSPTLRDRLGLPTSRGLPAIADEIACRVSRETG